MVDFSKLNSNRGANIQALQATLERSAGPAKKKDERIWKPVAGPNNTSESIIRFLPIPACDYERAEDAASGTKISDLTPMARILSHGFKGPKGQWYIENSLATFGEDCPVREFDRPNWVEFKKKGDPEKNPSLKAEKAVLMERMSRSKNYANILVISDKAHPENNGKVFLYEVPETIRKMIEAANAPKFENIKAFDPFDFSAGADLHLNIAYEKKSFGGRENLSPDFKSVAWAEPAPLFGGDVVKQEEVWRKSYSLVDFYDRKHFKTFEELHKKLCSVMCVDENFNPIVTNPASGQQMRSATDFIMGATAAPEAPKTAAVFGVRATPQPAAAIAQTAQQTAQAAAPFPPSAPTPQQAIDVGLEETMDDFERLLREAEGS